MFKVTCLAYDRNANTCLNKREMNNKNDNAKCTKYFSLVSPLFW